MDKNMGKCQQQCSFKKGESNMNSVHKADIQLTANVIIESPSGKVMLTQYDDDDERMWIPGASLNEYEHPDAAVIRAIADVGIVTNLVAELDHIESFRGRRGWHVMFNYKLRLKSEINTTDTNWFDPKNLPQTAHGEWERGVIAKALAR
jgi:hypothetical protein